MQPPNGFLARLPSYLVVFLIVLVIVGAGLAIMRPDILPESTRMKVSRVRTDLRTLATALESYYIDHDVYPAMYPLDQIYSAEELDKAGIAHASIVEHGRDELAGITTPIGYLWKPLPIDPFSPLKPKNSYLYFTTGRDWQLISAGPDGDYDADPINGGGGLSNWDEAYVRSIIYDPSNGATSSGDVMRSPRGEFNVGSWHGPPIREVPHIRNQGS